MQLCQYLLLLLFIEPQTARHHQRRGLKNIFDIFFKITNYIYTNSDRLEQEETMARPVSHLIRDL
jgi:hypothetical protein